MAVRYRNKKTKKVATFTNANPRLDRNKKDWERLSDKEPAAKSAEDDKATSG